MIIESYSGNMCPTPQNYSRHNYSDRIYRELFLEVQITPAISKKIQQ